MTDTSELQTSIPDATQNWDQFVRWARRFYTMDNFNASERDYKLTIVENLVAAQLAMREGDPSWIGLLRRGFGPPNNLTNWRFHGSFLKWCENETRAAVEALEIIWDASRSVPSRIDDFVTRMAEASIQVPLTEASFLHMAMNPTEFPIFRATPVSTSYALTGYPSATNGRKLTPGQRYEQFLIFLDYFIDQANRRSLHIKDRHDAQSLVWMITRYDLPQDATSEEQAEFATFLDKDNKILPKKLGEGEAALNASGRAPNTTHEDILGAMREFDEHHRNSVEWNNWEDTGDYRWAIELDGRRYPVNEIISRAIGIRDLEFADDSEANQYVSMRGFLVKPLQPGSEPQVWWVNQGATYQQEKEDGILWAPVHGKKGNTFAHWTNMTRVREGDFVLHYANTAIRAVSIVQQSSIQAPKPHSLLRESWQDEGYLVRTQYNEFTSPIPLKEIPLILRQGGTGGPFTRQGSVNQGYLFPAPGGLLENLVHSFDVNWPDVIVAAVGSKHPRLFKIAPGPGGSAWPECLSNGYICVGWDDVGDLRQYESFDTFLKAFRLSYDNEYKGQESKILEKAQELWTLRDLELGDTIVANKGIAEILGIGTVIEPVYDWSPARESMRHIVHVDWGVNRAQAIPRERYWAFKTVLELPSDFLEHLEDNVIEVDYELPILDSIVFSIKEKGLRISERTLRRYHLSLMTRGFVILAGVSGTGKTWLAEAYADSVGARYELVSVAPNWTTNEDLLGYFNPVTQVYYDTRFSNFIRRAADDYHRAGALNHMARPYHLILDEMNLARVEHYFASFLSAMEVRERYGRATIDIGGVDQLELTPNLRIVGTVNVDETTHGFADKVWDRAQLVEIDLQREDLALYLDNAPYSETLLKIWEIVQNTGPFAYRVVDEISAYVQAAASMGVPWEAALDEQILQKILPKLKGVKPAIGQTLEQLVELLDDQFPLSYERAHEMLEGFLQYGFASYFG